MPPSQTPKHPGAYLRARTVRQRHVLSHDPTDDHRLHELQEDQPHLVLLHHPGRCYRRICRCRCPGTGTSRETGLPRDELQIGRLLARRQRRERLRHRRLRRAYTSDRVGVSYRPIILSSSYHHPTMLPHMHMYTRMRKHRHRHIQRITQPQTYQTDNYSFLTTV